MARVVILEGPDGGGKTTLAQSFINAGFEYKHEDPPPQNSDIIAHYLNILYSALESPNNVVLDRLWLGERAYGPVCRNVDLLGEDGQRLFMRLHRSKPIFQYICLPPINTARANYEEKLKDSSDYVKSVERWNQIYTQYAKWLYTHGTIGVLYDYTQHQPDRLVSIVRDSLRMTLPKGAVGSTAAKYLFIGDRPNHPHIDVPFFAVTSSSGYLNKAVKAAGLKEHEIAFSNASGPNLQVHSLKELMIHLPQVQHIFLMGNVARDWFYTQITAEDRFDLLYLVHQIAHPSYLRRFRGHNPEVMAEIMRGCLNGAGVQSRQFR